MSLSSANTSQEVLVGPPAHPVPSLQGPFEESMIESVDDADFDIPIDAVTRRTVLLESPTYERIIAGRWKQKPGEKYHPLWKLIAQMTFGLHLLARSLAKSEDEVMKILQAHVDDIDFVLERTGEDFDLAHSDMHERLRCLKLPLQHGEVFDRMLEDRGFRASILEGNEKIEHIVARTKKALKDSMKDVQKGFDAANVLDTYINGLTRTWQRESPEHEAVYVAMVGNVEGWKRAFMDLHLQGNKVGGTLKKLMEIVAEMERRAAAVSRSQIARSQIATATVARSSTGSRPSSHKPLPMAPDHRHSTRGSSRSSTQVLRDMASPFSGRGSSRDTSSAEFNRHDTPQPPSGRQTPNTTLSTMLLSPQESNVDPQPTQSIAEAANAKIDGPPIELPADVPEDTLRLAPLSVRNRLSYTLGLKPKDVSEHRISSIYYPRALGDLLKIQPSPAVQKTPQWSAVKSESPHGSADYFSAHIRGSSVTLMPGEGENRQSASMASPKADVPRIAVRSPTIPAETQRVVSGQPVVMSSPGLTFHPSVMAMAAQPAAPVELPIENEHQEKRSMPDALRRGSRSTSGQLSSLGEPGPEIVNSEYDGEFAPDEPVPTFRLSAPNAEKPARVMSGMDLPEIVMDSLAAIDSEPTSPSPRPDQIALPQSPQLGYSAPGTPMVETRQIASIDEVQSNNTSRAGTPVGNARPAPPAANPSEETFVTAREAREASPSRGFVAELEAHVPADSAASTPKQKAVMPDSPIEMEAPAAHFVLPPRESAKEIKVVKQANPTIKKRAHALRAAAQATAKGAMKPKDFNNKRNSSMPEPIRPLKLKLTKMDGRMVPVQVHSPSTNKEGAPPIRSPRLSTDVISNILDTMSDTPATSPVGEAAQPEMSAPSVVRDQRSSKQFGPPESAPPPPGPGGRSMVNPDYANAGAFDGERKTSPKLSKRHSAHGKAGSIGGIKELFSGATSRRHSSDAASVKTRNQSISSSQRAGSDMIDPSGKDVLWFSMKHLGKPRASNPPAVGVSSA